MTHTISMKIMLPSRRKKRVKLKYKRHIYMKLIDLYILTFLRAYAIFHCLFMKRNRYVLISLIMRQWYQQSNTRGRFFQISLIFQRYMCKLNIGQIYTFLITQPIWRTLALQASNNVPFVSVINPLFIIMEIKNLKIFSGIVNSCIVV